MSERVPANRTKSDAEVAALFEQLWRAQRAAPVLPGWLPAALAILPYVLLIVTILNGLIGVVAILTPLLAAAGWTEGAGGIMNAYALICPQRPDHTFTLAGYPMAFEQRDLAMHLAFAVAGLFYVRFSFMRQPLAHSLLFLGLAPMLIDVALSTSGLLPATALSRSWTGALAAIVIVWWSYPRFDARLAATVRHVEQMKAAIAREKSQLAGDSFVL